MASGPGMAGARNSKIPERLRRYRHGGEKGRIVGR
jgi:hypothetical protein